jgi:hypothetical protein
LKVGGGVISPADLFLCNLLDLFAYDYSLKNYSYEKLLRHFFAFSFFFALNFVVLQRQKACRKEGNEDRCRKKAQPKSGKSGKS